MFKLSTSEEAIRKRQSRVKQAQAHRRVTFMAEYVRVKYCQIYEEADCFYKELVGQYPNKRKLTTCPEFKLWEKRTKTHEEDSTTTTQTSEDHPKETATADIQINVPLLSQTIEIIDLECVLGNLAGTKF